MLSGLLMLGDRDGVRRKQRGEEHHSGIALDSFKGVR
jgi:hypothetical protein